MNIHIVHLPVLQSLASQICMRTSKSQMINKWYQNQLFWVVNPEMKRLEVDVLEDDAIFDPRPERPSHWAISVVVGVVAWGESHSLRYADHRVTWSLPGHIWPTRVQNVCACARSLFSKWRLRMRTSQQERLFELKSHFISIQHFKAGNVKPPGMHWSKDF